MLILRILFLVVLVLGGLASLLLLLPFLKEGYGIEELPLLAGVAAALGAALALWAWLQRGSYGAMFWLGVAFVAAPLCAYAAMSLRVIVNDWRGRRLARSVRVVSVAESDIRWPGLDEPVGVRLDLELEHDVGLVGNLFPPKIVMGDPRLGYRDYFFGALDHGVDPMLATPIFEIGAPSRDVLARGGRVRVSYELFPASLARREGHALCLLGRAAPTPGRNPAPGGGDLAAAWFFAAAGGVIVDMSEPLTEALRRSSRLQGRPDEWRRLLGRLEPAALEAAGLARCASQRAGSGDLCYCPSQSESP